MATLDETRPVFLPVIIGTPRQGRLTEPAANFVFGEVSKRDDTETELIDIRKIPVRIDDAEIALTKRSLRGSTKRSRTASFQLPSHARMALSSSFRNTITVSLVC